jgi:hypothetical protein
MHLDLPSTAQPAVLSSTLWHRSHGLQKLVYASAVLGGALICSGEVTRSYVVDQEYKSKLNFNRPERVRESAICIASKSNNFYIILICIYVALEDR